MGAHVPSPSAAADRHDTARAVLSASHASPVEGECLACFVARVGCAVGGSCGGWEAVERYRAARAPAALGLTERLARLGADCAGGLAAACSGSADAALWGVGREHRERDLHTDELRVPHPLPPCHGVGPGSAQPCVLWVRGRRRRAGERFGCDSAEAAQPADSQARRT